MGDPRGLSRDLTALVEMGLIEQTSDGYRAKTEIILAFLPLRRNP
jgi:predicted transcriptional regulator